MKQGYKLAIAVGILFLLVGLNIIFLKLTKSIFDHTKNKIQSAKEMIANISQKHENITQINVSIKGNQSNIVEEKNVTLPDVQINTVETPKFLNQSDIIPQENNTNINNNTVDSNLGSNVTQNASYDKEFLSDIAKIHKITGEEETKLQNITEEGIKNISNVSVNNDEKQNKSEVITNVNNITSSNFVFNIR